MLTYAPPPGYSVNEAIHLIYSHYATKLKSDLNISKALHQKQGVNDLSDLTMDSITFAKFIRDTPELATIVSRTEVDLIFSSVKPIAERRLCYGNFLDALLELSIRIYPDADPIIALSNFLTTFVFALFDQPPSSSAASIIESVYNELILRNNT